MGKNNSDELEQKSCFRESFQKNYHRGEIYIDCMTSRVKKNVKRVKDVKFVYFECVVSRVVVSTIFIGEGTDRYSWVTPRMCTRLREKRSNEKARATIKMVGPIPDARDFCKEQHSLIYIYITI